MPLTLSVLTYRNQPPSRPIEHTFSGAGGSIGRESQNDLVLTDPGRVISRKHAQIQCIQDRYQLTNLGQNPIDLNGRPVGRDETVALSTGDRLIVGDYCVVVEIDANDQFQPPISTSAPAFTGAADPLDLGGPLLPDGDGHSAFGIDLGGGRSVAPDNFPERSFDHPSLSNVGTQRDELPGFREPLPPTTPMTAARIPDDYDPLDGFMPKAEPALAPARADAAPGMADDDPFALVAPEVSGPASPPPPYSPIPPTSSVTPNAGRQGVQPGGNDTQPVPRLAASAPTAAGIEYRQALRTLLDAAGVPELTDHVVADPDFPAAVGELLREAVSGLLRALAARALTKRELRVDVTMLSSTENNPLKFCPNAPEALLHLLAPRVRGGYLPPVRALRESYDDLQAHNLAVMAGMRAALLGVLQRFDPEELERRLGSRHLLDKLVSTNRKARLWDLVAQQHANLVREAQDEFDRIFGRAFRSAYEEQVRQIRAGAGKASSLQR